ncbi:MAG: ATP-binding cassette domain-containing protein [Bacteroidota bacterium]
MTISLSDAGKRFNRDWIFRHFNYNFTSGNSYAIVGPNGSGKSTLLQVVSGAVGLNEGSMIVGRTASNVISATESTENIYQSVSIAAPYLEVIEEMTATEFLQFHQTFKTLLPALTIKEMIDVVGLANASDKQIRYYSSGMKQRVKLAQAIFSDVPVILLDEPCTNLDGSGIALYQQLIATYCKDRLVIVSSNDEAEFGFCNEKINMMELK